MKPNKLKIRRIRFGMTQTELAEEADTTQNLISQLERGLKPSSWVAKKIADALATKPEKLFKEVIK